MPDSLRVPRVHGSGTPSNPYWIREADGSRYDGDVTARRVRRPTGYSAYSIVFVDDDGRWFDNAGMPMSPPIDVEVEDA